MKEILLHQFKAGWNTADWFVPLSTAIEDITPSQAATRSAQFNHSIEEILHHIIYWNELYLNRFKDPAFSFPEISNEDTFKNPLALTWQQACSKVNQNSEDWINHITNSEEPKLRSILPNTAKSWYMIIGSLINHAAYHTGQIITLRKEFNFWNAAKGVH